LISETKGYPMPETARAPRIAPLEPPYTPEVERALSRWMGSAPDVEPLALFRTLNVHEDLASRMRPLGAGILGHGLLDPRDRELVIHRTCARAGAEYEWGVHALAYGRPLGFTEEQLEASAHGRADEPCWSEQDALLLALADELHETASVSDELWTALAARFTDAQMIELLVTAGWYRLISYVINGSRVQLEPWAARFPGA
jgi:4-carboxymuconolactone decarboxylase